MNSAAFLSLVEWGKKNSSEFYGLWGRLAPREVNAEITSKDSASTVLVSTLQEVIDAANNEHFAGYNGPFPRVPFQQRVPWNADRQTR